MTVNSFGFAL